MLCDFWASAAGPPIADDLPDDEELVFDYLKFNNQLDYYYP
jgi:hypothetical protein